jgi:protein NrfD
MDIGFVWLHGGHWGFTTAVYLFFATVSGGAYLAGLLSYALAQGEEREERLAFARWSFLVALVAVAIAGIAILSHLARPLAGLLFPFTLTNFESWITRGTWILVSLGVFTTLQALWFHFGALGQEGTGASTLPRQVADLIGLQGAVDWLAETTRPGNPWYWVVAVVGLFPAMGTLYTGFELSVVETVPLWNSWTLPPLFIVSGIGAGIAAALALTVASEGASSRLSAVSATVVAVALLVSVGLLWTLWSSVGGSPAGIEAKAHLTAGALNMAVLVGASIVLSLIATPLLAWVGYLRGESSLTGLLVRPGLVVSLTLGVLGTFLIRQALLSAAVQDPVAVVGLLGLL